MASSSVRQAVKDRLLDEMLGSVNEGLAAGWKVLILDAGTTQVMSSSLKMSDILDKGVSVVEKLELIREPLNMPGVYFIQPSMDSVRFIERDFARTPLYPSVHIFFSSAATPEVLNVIKRCPNLVQRLKTLKEVNVNFLTADSRTVFTGHETALQRLMGANCDTDANEFGMEMESITSNLATMFSALNDFPVIRYKVGKFPEQSDPPGQEARSILTQRVANKLMDRMLAMQRAGQLPSKETCEVLVLDRSIDPVAPLVHEWSYESLLYDLLPVNGNVVKQAIETMSGKAETKDAVLDENDSLWVELRHQFIGNVYSQLHKKFTELQSQNKAARFEGSRQGDDNKNLNMKAVLQALPQYQEYRSKLSLHIYLSNQIKDATNTRHLTDLGEMEQSMIFGDKTSRDLTSYLEENGRHLQTEDKTRLLGCYFATHAEKIDANKRKSWQEKFGLGNRDMDTICNLQYLGVPIFKESASAGRGLFGRRNNKAVRQPRPERVDNAPSLSRFDPMLMEIVESMVNGRLSAEEYKYVRPPTGDSINGFDAALPASARTNRTGPLAKRAPAGAGNNTGSKRIIILIIGGITHGEIRCVHEMAASLNRDIVLVSTSIETPSSFLLKLGQLKGIQRFEVGTSKY